MRPENISPAELDARLDRLDAAGTRLRAMSVAERIAALDRVATAWSSAESTWRRRALDALPPSTGYAVGTIRHALDELWAALSERELTAVAERELTDRDGGVPERLAFHSLAGNVPGAGLFGVVAALVAGVPSVVKTAAREPVLPGLVAASIAAEDPRLGEALAVVHWTGGSEAHERLVLARSSLVLGYGRAETLDQLTARTAGRLLRFGPRLSVAVVCREAATAATAAIAARQIALFDQQGCLSPQYVVIEENRADTTAAFVDALATALRGLAIELPRAPLTLAEAAHEWRHVERQRWREQEGADVRVVGDDAAFSVTCDRSGELPGSPLNRHVVVLPVTSMAEAGVALQRLGGMVEAIGLAGPAARVSEVAEVAALCGAHRLCPLDRLQSPPFAWRQSGHDRLASFLVRNAAATSCGDRAA